MSEQAIRVGGVGGDVNVGHGSWGCGRRGQSRPCDII